MTRIVYFSLFGEEGNVLSEAESKKLMGLKQVTSVTISPSPFSFLSCSHILNLSNQQQYGEGRSVVTKYFAYFNTVLLQLCITTSAR